MNTYLTNNCRMQTNTSDFGEIRGQKRRRNELPGSHRQNRPCLFWKTECWKATWRNWRERGGACTHCGQLNEYPTLPTPLLPTPLSLIISSHISSWYQFIFVYFSDKILILHIFGIIMIIIRCSEMFQNVPGCSMFRVLSTAVPRQKHSVVFIVHH